MLKELRLEEMKDHLVVLTDNFAPVEMLLNPITGKPYSPESEHQLERPAKLVWSENYTIVVTTLVAITVIWFVYSFNPRPKIR